MSALVDVQRTSSAVAVLTLNDPDRRNILSSELVRDIATALDELEATPGVQALVVTGTGTAFCAGAELETLARAAEGDFGLIREVYSGFLRVLHSPLLTIAAVNGPAVGAGFNLALACDVRFAAESAQFICRFAELNIFPGGGHTWMLSRAVGHQAAVGGLLLGQTWNAADALRIGLVAEVVAPDEAVVDVAAAAASRLARLDPEYTRRLVRVLREAPLLDSHAAALEIEATHQKWSTRQPSFLDGLARISSSVGRHR
ncbi:enoyl-CoA hydratase-related protein [Streptomyces sp. NPDC004629]|uniref:enoyl-CoA hydratase-related protein n=1 Tax=Streptomyces sp. NPDC004629 TaxID=3364705 RepID=UPI0036793543